VTQVGEGIFWARLPLPMALDHVNSFILDDRAVSGGWCIVDPGMDTRACREIWEDLLRGPLAAWPVTRVVVTHHHPDHIGLAGWFMARGADLVTTRTSWLMARMLVLDEHPLPTPEALRFWRAAGMDPEIFASRQVARPFNFKDCVHPLPLGYVRISDGDTLTIGARHWRVRTGDGHAPEHATLWSDEDGIILGGDQLLPSISANLGVHPTEPDADPVAEWLVSCRRFQLEASSEHLVLPGHKLPFTGLPLRLRQMIENHEAALVRLVTHLETPRTAGECFAPLFKRAITPAVYGLALAEAVAHLNYLRHTGQVTRTTDEAGQWIWIKS
jgi:glyoxylase-like metal-dependent hydrolase (beta-lactamase superfamily II)